MNIDFFADFEDNKIVFTLYLPIHFIDKNENKYRELDNKIIYESNNINIDLDAFFKQVETLAHTINNSFYNGKLMNYKPDIKIHILDAENNKTAFDFIKANKNLQIVLDVNDFKKTINNLKNDEYPNLKINFKNSDDNISYKEFHAMYNKLNEIVEFINHYNLSPLEKVLLVYDIVKANEYKMEDKGENYGVSRNLNEIINNDKIVCVGFANLIDFLLKNLDIKSNTIILGYKTSERQHKRNYIYLKDDKYNIDGVFFLDSTWDSKKDDKYLDNYVFFLKPLNFFKLFRNDEYVVSPTKFKFLEKTKDELVSYINKLNEFSKLELSLILSQLIREYNPNVDIMMNLNNKSSNEILEIAIQIQKKYNKRISEEAFKNALYRVRKIEYINGILKNELSEKHINEVCNKYYENTSEVKLLKALNLYEKPTLNKDLNISKASSTEEDLLRMKLLKLIKEKINDMPENDYIKKM